MLFNSRSGQKLKSSIIPPPLTEMIKAVDGELGEQGVHRAEEEINECKQKHQKIAFSSFSLGRG